MAKCSSPLLLIPNEEAIEDYCVTWPEYPEIWAQISLAPPRGPGLWASGWKSWLWASQTWPDPSPPHSPDTTYKVSTCPGALIGPYASWPWRWGSSWITLCPSGPNPKPCHLVLSAQGRAAAGLIPPNSHRKCPSLVCFPQLTNSLGAAVHGKSLPSTLGWIDPALG